MFRWINDTAPEQIEIVLDGGSVSVPAGISLAAALLYLDVIPTRLSRLSATPRAPLCLMGNCFECLIQVDGVDNQRACQVQVRQGMQVNRMLPANAMESGE